jgi:hypothetical protein
MNFRGTKQRSFSSLNVIFPPNKMALFPPDERRYQLFLPAHEKRRFAQCLATSTVNGQSLRCTYRVRLDHLKASITHGRLHECRFEAVKRPLNDLVDRNKEQESEIWDRVANLVATQNLSVHTATSIEFRCLLEHAFREGYQKGVADGPRGDWNLAFHRDCPPCKATALRKRIISVAAKATTRQENLLKEVPFVSMTMDAGQIGRIKLFATNLVASNICHCFTHSITQVDQLDHDILRDLLESLLTKLVRRDIQVGTIICDGATYQIKALNFADLDSIQSRNSDTRLFSRLLYVPCLCHRLNNAYHRLLRDSAFLSEVIRSLRDLARFCRKPNQRRILGAICPEFIQTRWLYDHRLLVFVLEHAELINNLPENTNPVTDTFQELSMLLSTLFNLMTALESSTTPLARAFPFIADTVETSLKGRMLVGTTTSPSFTERQLRILLHICYSPLMPSVNWHISLPHAAESMLNCNWSQVYVVANTVR